MFICDLELDELWERFKCSEDQDFVALVGECYPDANPGRVLVELARHIKRDKRIRRDDGRFSVDAGSSASIVRYKASLLLQPKRNQT